ncbi:MAG: hypothetical protein HRT68_14705 [Flavobacteriaceae bacterium]|nr:hypothetical protein [Flavobacteriaceae bacterium]
MIDIKTVSNKYELDFHGKKIVFKFCELLAFRNAIQAIAIDAHFSSNHSGIEIITVCNLTEILILETRDVIVLKEIICDIFTPKELKLYI